MKRYFKAFATAALLSTAVQGHAVADTIKVGVIAPFSGPFAIWGKQFQEAINVYVAQNGTMAGEHTVEFIYKDSGGPKPDVAKVLAQELLIKDRVDYLAGLVFTPNALAMTLALKPRILILDEPTAGVPSSESHLIIEAVAKLDRDLAVLIIEHDMKLVFEIANSIIVLVNGGILTEGTPSEISANLQVRSLYLGERHD